MIRRIAVVLLIILVTPAVFAQVRYAAKFVCGVPGAAQINGFTAAPGRYFTAINVHTFTNVDIRKRFSVGLPKEETGQLSQFFPKALPAGRTMQVDCSDIYGHLNVAPGTFLEGYVELISNVELDVVSVHTVLSGSNFVSIDTLRVPRTP